MRAGFSFLGGLGACGIGGGNGGTSISVSLMANRWREILILEGSGRTVTQWGSRANAGFLTQSVPNMDQCGHTSSYLYLHIEFVKRDKHPTVYNSLHATGLHRQ